MTVDQRSNAVEQLFYQSNQINHISVAENCFCVQSNGGSHPHYVRCSQIVYFQNDIKVVGN